MDAHPLQAFGLSQAIDHYSFTIAHFIINTKQNDP